MTRQTFYLELWSKYKKLRAKELKAVAYRELNSGVGND